MEKEFSAGINDVFISYSRRNLDFAFKLHKSLVDKQFDVWFDQVSIPLGVDYQNQIDDGIEKAHNFVFIISPHSINSPYCLKEVERAVLRKKRIIPILYEELSQADFEVMHPIISKINWIYFRENQEDYDQSFAGLEQLLHKHENYIKYGTALLLKAINWEQNQRKVNYLLMGNDRLKAEAWMLKEFVNEQAPIVPTDLHCEYIAQSKKYINDYQTEAYLSFSVADKEISSSVGNALMAKGLTTWNRLTDTPAGENQDDAAKEGIEDADNFIYFISEKSILDEQCIADLDYAISLNKRIVPLLIEKINKKKLPEQIRKVQLIDFTDNIEPEENLPIGIKSDFEKDIDNILLKLEEDSLYYNRHKVWLSSALKWEREGNNPGVLLNGHQLQEGINWLKIGKKRKEQKPLEIHADFLNASEEESPNTVPQVFIAYDNSDLDFALMLNRELQSNGRITWFDHRFISNDVSYSEEIKKGIEYSENFLYIASTPSCISQELIAQAEYASKLNKRIITLQYHDNLTEKDFPQIIQNTPSINFTHRKGDFKAKFSEVIRTLDVDREYIKNHNKWAKMALAWQEMNLSDDLLLRGTEFNLADAWMLDALENNKQPKPSELQIKLVDESRNAIFAAQLKEQRNQRRLKRALVAAVALLIIALGFGVIAIFQTIEATESAKEAVRQTEIAEENAKKAEKEKEAAEEARVAAEANELLARKAEKQAQIEKDRADEQRKKAEASAIAARKAEQEAKNQTKIAVAATEEAKRQTSRAEAATIAAKQSAEIAKLEKERAVSLKNLAEARELAFKSIQSFNNENQQALKALVALYAYDNYTQNSPNAGEQQDPDIYSAIRVALETIDKDRNDLILAKQGSIRSMELSPNGKSLLTSGSEGNLKKWLVTPDGINKNEDATEVYSYAKHGTHLTKGVTISKSNNLLASGHEDGTVRIWEVGKKEHQLGIGKKGYIELKGHEYPVKTTVFSTDEKLVFSLDTEGNIISWDLTNSVSAVKGKPILLKGEVVGETETNYNDYKVIDILFDAINNKLLVVANHKIKNTGIIGDLDVTSSKFFLMIEKRNRLQSISLSPKGDRLAVGSKKGTIDIYEYPSIERLKALNTQITGVTSIDFSPDSRYLVSASYDKTIQLYDMNYLDGNPIVIRQNQWTYSVQFHPNSNLFFTSGDDEKIHIYQTKIDNMALVLKERIDKLLEKTPDIKDEIRTQLKDAFKDNPETYRNIMERYINNESQMTKKQ